MYTYMFVYSLVIQPFSTTWNKYYEAIGITPEKADTSRLSAMLFHRARAALGGKLLATKMDLKQHKGM